MPRPEQTIAFLINGSVFIVSKNGLLCSSYAAQKIVTDFLLHGRNLGKCLF